MIVEKGPRDFYKIRLAPTRVIKYLKYTVPVTHRYFENNAWFVHKDYLHDAQALGSSDPMGAIPSTSDDYSILHLRPTAPMAIVEAAWRALAKIHHPDRGGDPEKFKRISAAYERIKDGADE